MVDSALRLTLLAASCLSGALAQTTCEQSGAGIFMNKFGPPIGGHAHLLIGGGCFWCLLSATAQTVKLNATKMDRGQGSAIQMDKQRKRVRHTETFEERLSKEAVKFKEAADKLPPGSLARELLLRRVTQAETASNINKWLSSKISAKAC